MAQDARVHRAPDVDPPRVHQAVYPRRHRRAGQAHSSPDHTVGEAAIGFEQPHDGFIEVIQLTLLVSVLLGLVTSLRSRDLARIANLVDEARMAYLRRGLVS